MADNVTTQSTTPATLPSGINVATVEGAFSGDTVQAGIGVLAKTSGAEGSRTFTTINPATEDKQDTIIASLASTALPVGAGTATAAGRTTLASDDPAVTALQLIDNAVSGAGFNITQLGGVNVSKSSGATDTGTLRTIAASDDPAVATLGATSGAKVVTDATGTLQQYLRGLVTFFANALGAGTAATASRTVTATDDTMVGALTETAPTTDTASSGLNGRLQRIAQRLTALISPGLSASVTVTRPSDTTAYAAGDVVGVTGGGTGCIDFNLAAISASSIMITSVRLQRDVTAVISGETSYTIHWFSITQPGAQADNAVFTVAAGDQASYLGKTSIGSVVDVGATLTADVDGINKHVKLAGTHLFGVLVTDGAWTPASASVHRVTVNAVQL